MISVFISTDTRYPINRKTIRKAVLDVFERYKIGEIVAEVSVAVVGKRKMQKLCTDFIGDGQKHEVLTFALESFQEESRGFINAPDGILRLGDVILCWPYLVEFASRDNVLIDEKIYSLTSHGVKHLLGE